MGRLGTGHGGKPIRADLRHMRDRYEDALAEGDARKAERVMLGLGTMHLVRRTHAKAKECFVIAADSEDSAVRACPLYRVGLVERLDRRVKAARRWLDAGSTLRSTSTIPTGRRWLSRLLVTSKLWSATSTALAGDTAGLSTPTIARLHPAHWSPSATFEAALGNSEDATWWFRAAAATEHEWYAPDARKLIDKSPRPQKRRKLAKE